MHWRAESVLEAVAARVPEQLVAARELAVCRRIAERVPSGVRSFYLECRLDETPQVDFVVLLSRRRGAGQRLREARAGLRDSDVWRRNLALVDAWEHRSELTEVPILWFEYDIDERFDSSTQDASPSICVDPGYCARMLGRETPFCDRALSLATAGLCHVSSSAELREYEQGIRCVTAALPERGALHYVSPVYARREAVLKLYVSLPRRDVMGFLAHIGWSGDLARVASVLDEQYGAVKETAFLDLSWSNGALPRLGIALSQLHSRELAQHDRGLAWVPMPAELAEKRRALFTWPGQFEARVDGARTWIQRWLDMKFVIAENGELEIKAYLGFMPSPPPLFS